LALVRTPRPMPRKMVSFGESMIRFLPVEELPTPLPPSAKQDFVR
jgi:hypothetical protein